MKITKIELTGETNRKTGMPFGFASIQMQGDQIAVYIHTPDNDRTHLVMPDCPEDIYSMAQCLHERLDGRRGSNSEIHDYYRMLQHFAK